MIRKMSWHLGRSHRGRGLKVELWVGVLLFALISTASSQGREAEDVYDFGGKPRVKRSYKRDGKLIVDNDFYCSACAKEKRIAHKHRDDMAHILEFDKSFNPKRSDGTTKGHFGTFRMMEQEGESMLSFLRTQTKSKKGVFIEDRNFRVYSDLPSVHTKKKPYRRRLEELEELNEVFPKVTDKTIVLNSHQRAHQCLVRVRRIRREFQALMRYNPKKQPFSYLGPWMGLDQKYEIYVFAKKKSYFLFLQRFLGKASKDSDGITWHNLKDKSMVVALHAEGLSDTDLNNALTHRFAYALITGYSQYRYDLPAWLALGYAHLMERRERSDFDTLIFGEGKTPKWNWPSKWKPHVRRKITSRKVPSLSSYAQKDRVNDLVPNNHPLAWSLVSFLVQHDQKAFSRLVTTLKTKKDRESTRDLVIRALKVGYKMSILQLDARWQDWVKETYPKN
ncbi:MAG: hypothetical protein V3W41_12800 [Planctomycetota bacterium]